MSTHKICFDAHLIKIIVYILLLSELCNTTHMVQSDQDLALLHMNQYGSTWLTWLAVGNCYILTLCHSCSPQLVLLSE